MRAAGGEAYYHAVDLTDPDAVAGVMAGIRDRHGRVDVLLHAAGLDISHAIADKEPREYDLVFDVKSDGLFNLLHAAADLPIGRDGRVQLGGRPVRQRGSDRLQRRQRPAVQDHVQLPRHPAGHRGDSLDWTAWGGLGMATRGSIPKVMAMAGIEMLAPEAGIPWIGRELTAGPFSGEVVVGGQLGVLTAETRRHRRARHRRDRRQRRGPMIGTITGMGIYSGLSAQTTPRSRGAAIPARSPDRPARRCCLE